jgi:hypothetical protein
MAGQPRNLVDVVTAGVEGALADVHTALPGTVVSYDPLTNTATVKPMVKRVLYDVEDGERSFEDIPNIPSVPVVWPRAGGFAVTLPMQAGDSVLLIFSQASLAEWRESGELSEPVDARTHSVGYPFAIPGAFPDVTPLSPDPVDIAAREAGVVIGQHAGNGRIEISPTTIKLGKDATDYVALAAFVDARIAAVATKFDSHVHLAAGATALTGTPQTAAGTPNVIGTQASVAATRTKAK